MPRPVSALQFLQVRHRAWPPRALIGTCSSVTVLPEDAWSRAKPVRQIGQAVLPRSYKRSRLLLPVFRDMPHDKISVPLRDRCNFGWSLWLISQALSVTYVAGEHRLYLERSCRLPENPATVDGGIARGLPVPRGLNSQRRFGPAVERCRKSRPRSAGFHGSSPCKCQRLSTLRWGRLPPSRPPTNSGARAGGRRLSDRRLHG